MKTPKRGRWWCGETGKRVNQMNNSHVTVNKMTKKSLEKFKINELDRNIDYDIIIRCNLINVFDLTSLTIKKTWSLLILFCCV